MNPYFLLLVSSPFLVGSFVGLCGPRHPVRNAIATVLLAGVAGMLLCPSNLMALVFLFWSLPLLAVTMLGTFCGAAIRQRAGRGGAR